MMGAARVSLRQVILADRGTDLAVDIAPACLRAVCPTRHLRGVRGTEPTVGIEEQHEPPAPPIWAPGD